MKKWNQILLCFFLFSLYSCGKKTKEQYSTWSIDNQQYSDIAIASVGKAVAILGNNNTNEGFKLVFFLNHLPLGDYQKEWTIIGDNPDQDPTVAGLFFYLSGNAYYISEHNTTPLIASSIKGKAKYALSGAWFVNYNNAGDSVFIKATLNEP
ncbi:hypothetical protein F0919_08180 [Taibaiella lutea]|uniref:Uncharacterized protein n=1 Tax=Taibaiella lutea TaxID=2608001 RepID=A0A5M6CN67_9BACT|nr:hypothetical protein [Taibaiella lutea]KAA5534589.1 hypothetical protein F0919_08180 [Taibaiella lutea]